MTPDDRVDAAELALGLTEGEERAAGLRRMLAEPPFAREVEWWRARFDAMLVGIASAAPPAAAMPPVGGTAQDAAPWRWATGSAALVAAGLAVALVVRPAPLPPASVEVPVRAPAPAPLSAALTPTDAAPGSGTAFAALYDRAQGQVRVAAGIDVPAGRSAELWRIGADGVPHSLGLLSAAGTSAIALSPADREALAAGATLAVSIEPAGGAPGAAPTGPVVATGKLAAI